jgi:outer membrane protein assembly factor BamB
LRLSFKPDGTQLAAAAQDQLTIWDLSTGKHAHDLTPVGAGGSQIAWPADGFVLLDGQYLVALDKKMTVWTYEAENGQPAPQGTTYGGRYWYVARGGQASGKPVLVSVGLPDEPVRRAAAAANPDNDLLVRPGATVSLDVNVVGDIREKSTAGIRQRLTENGVTVAVANNAPLKLVAQTAPGETREIEYRAFGALGGNAKVSATGMKYLIAFQTADGKVLWERKVATSPPPMLMMKQGQSVEQAVAEAMKPSPAFFEAKIPRYVPKSKNGAGTSRLGPAGVSR